MSYFSQVNDDEDRAWEAAMSAVETREAVEKAYDGARGERWHEGRERVAEAMARQNRLWDDACAETEKRIQNENQAIQV